MRALYWDGAALKLNSAYRSPECDHRTALVKVHLAGICSTDLQIFKGYMGFQGVPGHEFIGSVSDGPEDLIGRRVVGEINFGCGQCDYCHRGLARHCPSRDVMGILRADGAFAEWVAVPVTNLHVVPQGVSDEAAVFTEPLAAAFEILEQVQIDPGDAVLILGDGKLASLCAQVLRLASGNITLVGKHSEKLKLIKRWGIRTMLLPDWQAKQFELVVEATGSPGGLELAMKAVRPRGTLVLKTTLAGAHSTSLAPLVINEIHVVGSRCGPFAPALDALKEKTVAVTELIEKVYPLSQCVEAIDHAGRPGARKILLRP
ncbi:MAG: alcohol dehydrogenase catalytic domain-containing protein [Candidatus Binatia bacterium]